MAEGKRSDLGHRLGENRQEQIGKGRLPTGYGQAERKAAVQMAQEIPGGRSG